MVSTNGNQVDTMETSQVAKRRRHDASLKRAVLEQCAAPGASVASIALAHGLNANLVHKWRREARPTSPALGSSHDVGPEPRFVALNLPPPVQPTVAEVVQLELRRGALTKPVADLLHAWLLQQRALVPSGSATARAIQYSLSCWEALTRYLDDGRLPPDNNRVENQIRPVALGRANWLFAGSLRAGKRAAAVMSLVHSARLNGHDPYAYLRDVLERLPTQPASRIGELLPHRWQR